MVAAADSDPASGMIGGSAKDSELNTTGAATAIPSSGRARSRERVSMAILPGAPSWVLVNENHNERNNRIAGRVRETCW